ncbi:MAG: helix-hairpin-helix domain-containing protein [bacterium]
MKVKQVFNEYFTFSRSEQKGVVILVAILLGICGVRICLPSEKKLEPVEFAQFETEIMRFEATLSKVETKPQEWKTSTSGFVIELNSADTLDLQRLRGIGSAFARRITGYRDKLGGFTRKEQLLEVWGMDSIRYQGIEGHISVDPRKIRKIALNTASFKELMRHPYMPYELAKAVVVFRKKQKKINTVEELKQIPEMQDSTFRKLLPYISVD